MIRTLLRPYAQRGIRQLSIKAEQLLDELYTSVRAQRFEDIVVIQTNHAKPKYIILASAFNPRHLISGTEMVNKSYKNSIKTPDLGFAQLSAATDWNVMDFEDVVVHLFSKKCRDQYDIEQLWSVGEEYDDLTNFQSISEPSSASMPMDHRIPDSGLIKSSS